MRRPILFVVIVASTVALAVPLGAHAEIRSSAPEARQVVGGEVDHVDILYWVPGVRSAAIEVISPSGPIEVGETTISVSNTVASVEFAPLTEPGDYLVRHKELSVDGDETEGLFAFSFDPESSNVVGSLAERGGDGPNWLILGGALGLILVAVGVFWPGRRKGQQQGGDDTAGRS